MNRRKLLGSLAALAAAGWANGSASAAEGRVRVLIFTKHLQFISDYERMAATAKELGFDGLDVTVRPGGHVLPENVERDLPKMKRAADNAGLPMPMITTAIQDATKPETRAILETAAGLGVGIYRIGDWKYSREEPIPDQMKKIQDQFVELAALNRKYNITAAYQNHSGEGRAGASLWDLDHMMQDLDTKDIGINFDLGHSTVEGGLAWPTDFQLVHPRTKVITIKDFRWGEDDRGRWRPEWCPLGEGMIDVAKFLKLMSSRVVPLVTLHFEYEVKDASGKKTNEALMGAMMKDAARMKKYLSEAGLG